MWVKGDGAGRYAMDEARDAGLENLTARLVGLVVLWSSARDNAVERGGAAV